MESIIFPQHAFGPRKQPVHHELGDSLGQVEDGVETGEHNRHVQWRREVHRPHEIRRYRVPDGSAGRHGRAWKNSQSYPVPRWFARRMRWREDPPRAFQQRHRPGRAHIMIQLIRYRIKNRIFLDFLE